MEEGFDDLEFGFEGDGFVVFYDEGIVAHVSSCREMRDLLRDLLRCLDGFRGWVGESGVFAEVFL